LQLIFSLWRIIPNDKGLGLTITLFTSRVTCGKIVRLLSWVAPIEVITGWTVVQALC